MQPVRNTVLLFSLSALTFMLGCDAEPDKSGADDGGTDSSDADDDDGGDDDGGDDDGGDDDGDDTAAPGPVSASLSPLDGAAPSLTELAAEAVAVSPAWLQDDLTLAFMRLDDRDADELAAVIVDLDEPWLIDEVAFAVAHTSPELTRQRNFYPELFVENARYIYEVDPHLDYVDLVESGEAGVDSDWTTTVTYRVAEGPVEDGIFLDVELPPELYYWYVVHPRIEDEGAYYIDAWDVCRNVGLECEVAPEEGSFWRSFLWDQAAEQCPEGDYCPVLADFMPAAEVLWSTDGGGSGAIGEIARFMHHSDEVTGRWLTFGAHGERSIQPVRIYALGRGNCGEWADMTSALARTSLIPNMNVTPASWDHTWNEFYDPIGERWVAWEPVNWWFDHGYGAPYANYATRGDTRVTHVTDRYSDTYDLEITVVDSDGRPVDGASVMLWSPYDSSWWYAGEGATGSDGVLTVPVTAGMEFAVRVESVIGAFPPEDNTIDRLTSGAEVGALEQVSITIDASTQLVGSRSLVEVAADAPLQLTVSGMSRDARIVGESFRFAGHTYTQEAAAPQLSWFVTDAEGYAKFIGNDDHDAFHEDVLGEGIEVGLHADAESIVVVVNDLSVAAHVFGEWSLSLTNSNGDELGAMTETLVLAPGAHHAVAVVPE